MRMNRFAAPRLHLCSLASYRSKTDMRIVVIESNRNEWRTAVGPSIQRSVPTVIQIMLQSRYKCIDGRMIRAVVVTCNGTRCLGNCLAAAGPTR